jgi:uncharacterized protein
VDDNLVVWASIPAGDFARALKFYEHVLGIEMAQPFEGQQVAVPAAGSAGQVAFDLSAGDTQPGGESGPTVYFGSGGDIHAMAKRVEEAGGRIVMPPTDMGEMVGIICMFIDSEGNRVGIHQPGAGKRG